MYEPRRSLKPFRRHNGVKYHAPLMKVPFIRVQQGVLTGSWRIKDGGREGGDGVSPSVLLRRTSKRKMQSWRFRSNRGHCRACSFSFRLLLGYYTLSIQYYGVFFTRLSLHSGTPFFCSVTFYCTSFAVLLTNFLLSSFIFLNRSNLVAEECV